MSEITSQKRTKLVSNRYEIELEYYNKLGDYVCLSEVEDLPAQRTAHIGDALEYPCCFWASHLVKTASSDPGNGEVLVAIDYFFTTCFLFWIEVLSLVKNLNIGVYALNNISQWYTKVSYM